MSDKNTPPVFQPPPPGDDVPEFLKGNNGPTYRASGSYGGSYAAPARGSPAPAPLKFAEPSGLGSKQATHNYWGQTFETFETAFESGTKGKQVELGERTLVAAVGGSDDVDVVRGVGSDEASWSRAFPSVQLSVAGTDTETALRELVLALGCPSDVDTEIDVESSKVRGVVYDNCQRCFFVLHLCSHENQGGMHRVVEFQRRSGPPALFSRFVSATMENFTRQNLLTHKLMAAHGGVAESLASLSGGPAAPTPQWSVDNLDQVTCAALVSMCGSDFEDVRLEALWTLAPLSADAGACSLLFKHCGDSLVGLLLQKCTGDDMEWCVAFLCAHLCGLPEFAAKAAPLMPLLFSLLSAAPTLNKRGTKRQAAQALELLSQTSRACEDDLTHYLDVLEPLVGTTDPQLKTAIERICNNLLQHTE